jgi:hypothetical protein
VIHGSLPGPDRYARLVALIVAVLLHLTIISILNNASLNRSDAGSPEQSMVWLRLDQVVERLYPAVPRSTEAPPVPAQTIEARVKARSPSSAASVQKEFSIARDAQPAMSPMKWRAAGTLAAQSAVEADLAAKRYRHFGFPAPPEPQEAPAPSIFEKSAHELGTTDEDVMGNPVVWLSDHCFQPLANSKPVKTAPDLGLPTAAKAVPNMGQPKVELPLWKCSWGIGKREPRGDLFDHLKRRAQTGGTGKPDP